VPIRWEPRRTDLSGNPAQRYLRLLINVAKEGNAGLVRAVDWFDPERGLRDRGRAIRLPLHEGETETGSPGPTPPARDTGAGELAGRLG
jgi:hypothetical protein